MHSSETAPQYSLKTLGEATAAMEWLRDMSIYLFEDATRHGLSASQRVVLELVKDELIEAVDTLRGTGAPPDALLGAGSHSAIAALFRTKRALLFSFLN